MAQIHKKLFWEKPALLWQKPLVRKSAIYSQRKLGFDMLLHNDTISSGFLYHSFYSQSMEMGWFLLLPKHANGVISSCDIYSLENKWIWPLWYRYRFQDKYYLNTKWSKSVDLFLPRARFLKGDMRRKCCTEQSKYLLYWIQHQQGRQRSFFLSQQHMAILQFE